MKIRRNRNHILTNATFKKLLIIGEKDPVIDVNSSLDEAQKTNIEFIIFDGGYMSYVENTKKL
ncbi:MAG: alpha/beta hydrolase, partial [Polaribacter sp.]|nr:alpha/beta hydrolase [Polaribacter sp.]